MPGGVSISFLVAELIFLGTGILITVATVMWMNERKKDATTESVARLLLLADFPLSALLGNAAMIFVGTATALPAFAMPTSRGWLKIHAWFVTFAMIMTLVLGLNEWIQTLQTRAKLNTVWGAQNPATQSLLQKEFNCCGYTNYTSPPFVVDLTCPNDVVAATKSGCINSFSTYAERWLNLVFTAAFGIVGLDFVLILCIAMVIKRRKELLRYRRIDEKMGMGSI
ncbi:hypothetical protein DFH27DRAFT_589570 [Peziza echinospora]|nr:hypothetical protein DFH27DRAFT_589570 [Peziza echinospora]